ncbi:MAG: porin [Proteobacteria bacterium]|nr:porin [Pseudomonadota bacterium]
MRVTHRILGPLAAGGLLAAVAAPAGAADFTTSDGNWTFSVNGEINVDYIWSNCQNPNNAAPVSGGLTCVGSANGSSNVSNIGNGLLPASISFGVKTTQNGFDIAAHFGLFPGIATNDGGSPNLQTGNGPTNTALGSTSLDIRQVYLTFGNKDIGTFTFGRNIGLFGADVILNDMTLPGVGAPGSAAGPSPSNTTLGGIGFGYIYTDWLAQIDYTSPDFAGFNFTVGAFDPINSLSDAGTTQPKKAPGFHAKLTYTMPFNDTTKLYVSVAGLTQKQDYVDENGDYTYNGNGVDVFAKIDVSDLEAFLYYYHATGLGTTALFDGGAYNGGPDGGGDGQTRKSDGWMAQVTYKLGAVKLGANYGRSNLDYANGFDAEANPFLVSKNEKGTIGAYYSLTKNLTLLLEGTRAKSTSQAGGSNSATTINIGAYLGF